MGNLLLVMAIVACAAGLAEGSPWIKEVELFKSRTGGYHTYRIPALVAAGQNTLLAFCEGRKNSASDSGDIDILLRRSLDGGRTWKPVQLVVSDGTDTCGNPCPIFDGSDGTVWLLFCKNPGHTDQGSVMGGGSRRTAWVTKSTDCGVTWSSPTEITSSVKKSGWRWYATGPGHGIQLRSGRLVAACDHSRTSGKKGYHHSHIVYSDDHGKSWKIGGIVDDGTNESTAVELPDGRVYINCRNARRDEEAPLGRVCAYSEDGGQTFAKAGRDDVLIEPICQGSVVRVPGSESDGGLVLFSNPASGKREKMTVRLSRDGCRSWPVARMLYAGPSAYSDLAVAEDSSICCMYERGRKNPYESISLAMFNMAWLAAEDGVGSP